MEILIQTCLMPLAIKTQNDSFLFVHELKKEMHADLKYVESLKKEIDELESDKAEFSNMYDMILKESVSNEVMCSYLLSLSDLDALAKASNVFRKEREQYIKILDLKAQLQDKNIAISELKKLIEKGKGKSVETKFDKPSVTKSVPKNVSEGLSKPVTAQTLPQTARKAVCNTNVLKPGKLTKKPNVVPISTRKPKSQANKSVATPHKKKVASKSTNQKPQSYYRMLYDKMSKTWKWWIKKQSTSGYKWVPKTKMQWVPKAKNENVQKRIVQLIMFIVDSGCTKHMTSNLKLLCNFVEKFLGFITSKASITIFSQLVNFVMQIWRSDLYTISLQESTTSTPRCLMAKATQTQAWLWLRRLSHLNFDYINLLLKKDVVIGLPKLKYVKDQLCFSCELSKAKRSSFKLKAVPSSKGRLNLLHVDLCGPMRVASINRKKYILSKRYRVYNKRTRMIVESIHIRFNKIQEVSETSVANDTSSLVPQRQKVSNYDNSDPVPQLQNVSSSADAHVPSQHELDLLFSPLYDEFFNAGFNLKDTQLTTNIQPTYVPSTPTYVHAEENNANQAEEDHLPDDKFTNKQENDKIKTKPDKNGKRGKARQCQVQSQSRKQKREEIQTQGINTGKS
nr:retrovirus-related Pol polyprotein from transposon TNT 1-94 [Tanacetum cinerariifolium]